MPALKVKDSGQWITIDNGVSASGILSESKFYTDTKIDEIGATKIPIPSVASIGQIIVVKDVDENGKPIQWETIDPWVITSSTQGSTKRFKLAIDDNGVLTATEIIENNT